MRLMGLCGGLDEARVKRQLSHQCQFRRVIKPRLIAVFVSVVTSAIVAIGYLFNAIF